MGVLKYGHLFCHYGCADRRNKMEKQELLNCFKIMDSLKGKWSRNDEGLYCFYNPEEIPPEGIKAAEMLNENYIAASKEWEQYIKSGGNEVVEFEVFEDDDDD